MGTVLETDIHEAKVYLIKCSSIWRKSLLCQNKKNLVNYTVLTPPQWGIIFEFCNQISQPMKQNAKLF